MPTRLIYIFFFSSLPKRNFRVVFCLEKFPTYMFAVYFNALLANLNFRKSVSERMERLSMPLITHDLSFRKGKTAGFQSTSPVMQNNCLIAEMVLTSPLSQRRSSALKKLRQQRTNARLKTVDGVRKFDFY
jgi:hypothetical protein